MPDAVTRLTTALAGRYCIERALGAGGMATVYLARDLKHDRDVALKELRPELAAVLGAERFLPEIRISARPSDPGPTSWPTKIRAGRPADRMNG